MSRMPPPNPYGSYGQYPRQQPYQQYPQYQGNPPSAPYASYGSAQPLGYESAQTSATVGAFFNAVYGWMAAGLALTAVVAWWVSTQSHLLVSIFNPATLIILFIAELALVFTVSAAVNKISASAATALFLLYAALNGVTLSAIFLVYTHAAIMGAFVTSAATFGAMSVYGFTTRRDLSRYGSLLFMGLIGVVIASVVSMFWHNTMLDVLINYVGVFVFIGLTAYDTQKLRSIAVQTSGSVAMSARYAIVGALTLYLDFINLFLFLLRILGDRRR